MKFELKWMTMGQLAERVGVKVSALSKALSRGRISGTRWKGRVFFDEEQVKFAESVYARSSRLSEEEKAKRQHIREVKERLIKKGVIKDGGKEGRKGKG